MAEKKHLTGNMIQKTDEAPFLVFFPNVSPGMGMGHLSRAYTLSRFLSQQSYIFIDGELSRRRPELAGLLQDCRPEKIITSLEKIPDGSVALVDMRETPAALFQALSRRLWLIGIDEVGRMRRGFHYLLDTLLMVKKNIPANIQVCPVRLGKKFERPLRFPFRKILISFGGEDRADLSARLLEALLGGALFSPDRITVVQGPLFGRTTWPPGVRVLQDVCDFAGIAAEHDLLFTHYGISCYEALSRGVPIITLNPSSYHQKLALKEGFPSIGVNRPSLPKLMRLLEDKGCFEKLISDFEKRALNAKTASDVLGGLSPSGSSVCPFCLEPADSIERFEAKTYFYCPRCSSIRMVFWGPRRLYLKGYFFEEYRAQYGKTYLEDFENIKKMGEERLAIIKRLLPALQAPFRQGPVPVKGHSRRLLDVGAAFGPFCAAAKEGGYKAEGIEINSEAAAYIRDTLKIPCREADFSSEEIGVRFKRNSYDIITMWYVMEHFEDPLPVLAKANALLAACGIFAFATPNVVGISGRKNRRLFLKASPDDHYTVWSPRMARRVLKHFGFQVKKVRVTGHHPERFFGRTPGRLLGKAALIFSKVFRLGDTFEVYAKKIGEAR